MDRGRVGEDRGSKETDGCPLTIMCVVDSLTKFAHFILMHTTIHAKGTVLLFLKEVWKRHGMPRVVVPDRHSSLPDSRESSISS
jgi:hypothetical protein